MKEVKLGLNSGDEFIIENYNLSKHFASFLPGVAGFYGIPMWVFYVNRGQCIASFGIQSKDHPILEFFPANRSWQLAPLQGFRTFIKIKKGQKEVFYEPFQSSSLHSSFDAAQKMLTTSYDLKLEEENRTLGIKTEVTYFTMPNESFAALARIVKIKNTKKTPLKLELLDGMPVIMPYGVNEIFMKKLSRTVEAWMEVSNLDKNAAFYKLKVDPTDRAEVIPVEKGNFYFSFHYKNNKAQSLKPIVEPALIFGPVSDFCRPVEFVKKGFAFPKKQMTRNFTPCAFSHLSVNLEAGQEKTICSIIGHAYSLNELNRLLPKFTAKGYIERKEKENKENVERLVNGIFTVSGSKEFDLYCKQTFLDNALRGGYPVSLPTKNGPVIFYIYSRRHGDLERDYNKFLIQPTYFSQGNGSYRDINQNRRNDVFFNPDLADTNIYTFYNLIQPDGFNPLVVKTVTFSLKDSVDKAKVLKDLVEEESLKKVSEFLEKPFEPGPLLHFLDKNNIKMKVPNKEEFLRAILTYCQRIENTEHGEGFWTDHWAYNLDLLESYLGIYPEKLKDILLEKKDFTFYDNSMVVRARSDKYVLKNGKVRQYGSVVHDGNKELAIRKRQIDPLKSRTKGSSNGIYKTNLMEKLVCIITNKLASLDPFGVGIEMEADKPDWYDALNGLPGLFGSSVSETLELKRHMLFIKDAVKRLGLGDEYKLSVIEDIHDFMAQLSDILQENLSSSQPDRDFIYWDKSYALKEKYRETTRFGFGSVKKELSIGYIKEFLDNGLKKLDIGIEKSFDKKSKIYRTYFINEVIKHEPVLVEDKEGNLKPKVSGDASYVKALEFEQKPLNLFLEGPVHALRVEKNKAEAEVKVEAKVKAEAKVEAKALYEAIRKSDLYDKKLKMYKVNASLGKESVEIGRCRVFTPGWLENESVWLHMEYKYLLELLRRGLYEEYFQDLKNTLVPFLDPQKYGRSTLENSSFIVSSAYPDPKLHGNGFVARLSGSTAEFIHMWLLMCFGDKPFALDEQGKLVLRFNPVLPEWLFTKKPAKRDYYADQKHPAELVIPRDCFACNFLKNTLVVYHNPKRKNTYASKAVRPVKISFQDPEGKIVEIKGDTIPLPYSENIREGLIARIDIELS